MRFLGVGNAISKRLGSSCAVLLQQGKPLLLIDIGPDTLSRFGLALAAQPEAVFITHAHLDHIADLEPWFYQLAFAESKWPRLYVPASLVPILQRRVADFPNWVAEGGRNFWDVFQLIPVSESFWHAGLRFDVFAVRHHAPNAAFGLALPGSFVYSGDTRPIPDQLAAYPRETIFHDVSVRSNPSHTGLADLDNYHAAIRDRLWLYHYGDDDARALAGWRVVNAGTDVPLAAPDPAATSAGMLAWTA